MVTLVNVIHLPKKLFLFIFLASLISIASFWLPSTQTIEACAIDPSNPPVQPIISSITPTTANVGDSFTLTITGNSFNANAAVYLDSNPLTIDSNDGSTIVAQVPSFLTSSPTQYTIYVYNPPPSGGCGLSATYQYLEIVGSGGGGGSAGSGTLEVAVQLNYAPATPSSFSFSYAVTPTPSIITVPVTNTGTPSTGSTFFALNTGIYGISEQSPDPNWSLMGTGCSNGDAVGAVTINDGDLVTCTFSYEYGGGSNPATINIIKYTNIGAPSARFYFDFGEGSGNPPTEDFTFVDATTPLGPGGYTGTTSFTVDGTAGFYELTESLPDPNWVVDYAFCTYADGSSAGSGEGDFVGFNLLPGQEVTCEFSNSYIPAGGGGAQIQIFKNADGGTGVVEVVEFDGLPFALQMAINTVPNSFSSGSSGLRPIAPGNYTISERPRGGWNRESANCTNAAGDSFDSTGGDPMTIPIVPGDVMTCTFNNRFMLGGGGSFCGDNIVDAGEMCDPPDGTTCDSACQTIASTGGRLIVNKVAWGSAGTFQVSVMPSPLLFNVTTGPVDVSSGSAAGSSGPMSLPVGTYNIAETPDPAWTVANVPLGVNAENAFSCNKKNPGDTFFIPGTNESGGTFTIADGLDTYCSITNEWTSWAKVIKRTIGGDGKFTFGGLSANIQYGDIATIGGYGDTSTATGGNVENGKWWVYPGRWSLGETVKFATPGELWAMTSVDCTLEDGTSAGGTIAAPAMLNGGQIDDVLFQPGKTTTCTFVNTKVGTPPPGAQGTLRMIKNTTGGNDTFPLTITGPNNLNESFTTIGGTDTISRLVDPGSYQILESMPSPQWTLQSVSCVDGAGVPTGSPIFAAYGMASVVVGSGKTTTCTFNNAKASTPPPPPPPGGNCAADPTKGCLQFYKTSQNGNGTFNFQIAGPNGYSNALTLATAGYSSANPAPTASTPVISGLAPGLYGITETSIPSGWLYTGGSCLKQDGTPAAVTPTTDGLSQIPVIAGQITSCYFSNQTNFTPPPPGKGGLLIQKNTTGGDGTFLYHLQGNFITDIPVTTSSGTGDSHPHDSLLMNLDPQFINITEMLPGGWNLDGVNCSMVGYTGNLGNKNTNGINNVVIYAGETTICTFDNSKSNTPPPGTGTLVIDKTAWSSDGTFNFTINGFPLSVTTFGSTLIAPGKGSTSIGLAPGSNYVLTEILNGGWIQTKAECTNLLDPTGPLVPYGPGQTITINDGEVVTCKFENTMQSICK